MPKKTSTPEATAREHGYTPGFKPIALVIEHGGHPKAPRLTAAWEAVWGVLSDGEPHKLPELAGVTDLQPATIQELLAQAVRVGQVEAVYDSAEVEVAPGKFRTRRSLSYYVPAE